MNLHVHTHFRSEMKSCILQMIDLHLRHTKVHTMSRMSIQEKGVVIRLIQTEVSNRDFRLNKLLINALIII